MLAGIVGASVQGWVALGSWPGARVRRLGDARDTETVTSRGPRQAHLEGFDLHAYVWVSANDRAGLERLCRYVLRPPFAQERLRLPGDGRVALELKQAWRDGARELVFELTVLAPPVAAGPAGTIVKSGSRAWSWAALRQRAFATDVLACPQCAPRLRLIATLHNRAVIRKILAHLGMARSGPSPGPAPPEAATAAS